MCERWIIWAVDDAGPTCERRSPEKAVEHGHLHVDHVGEVGGVGGIAGQAGLALVRVTMLAKRACEGTGGEQIRT